MTKDQTVLDTGEKQPSDRVASTIVVEFDGSRAEEERVYEVIRQTIVNSTGKLVKVHRSYHSDSRQNMEGRK